MKRSTVVLLSIGGALVLIGAFLFAAVMTAQHWDFAKVWNANFETETIAVDEAFEKIVVRTDSVNIAFLPSDDGTCRVEFFDWQQAEHTASVQDGTLTVTATDTRAWQERLFSFGTRKVTVYLTQSAYESLFAQARTGDVAVAKDFTFHSVEIDLDTGDAECLASASERIQIGTDTGTIRLANLHAGALLLSTSTGDVAVRSVTCTGDAEITVHTGKVRLNDVTCRSLRSKGSTGDLILEGVLAEDSLTAERSTGDVLLTQCDAATLEIKTGTGDVTGSLLSAKVFSAKSDTGRVSIPDTATGGVCRITTGTGRIEITVP